MQSAAGPTTLSSSHEDFPVGEVLWSKPARSPNHRLRSARLKLTSPSGSGRPLSRQELADLLNADLARCGVNHAPLDGTYIGKLERGLHRWPQAAYRAAFRRVLGSSSDSELGFFIIRSLTS